jgi:hypothetical protein
LDSWSVARLNKQAEQNLELFAGDVSELHTISSVGQPNLDDYLSQVRINADDGKYLRF